VKHDVRLLAGDDLGQLLVVADVRAVQPRPALEGPGQVALLAGGEVVDDGDLVPALEQGIDEIGSDEAGSAGDEGAHGARC
jgi:hypothetical protein